MNETTETVSKESTSSSRRRVRLSIPDAVAETTPILLAMIALGAYASIKSPFFLTGQNLTNILQQTAILGLITMGMTFLMIAGYLDLSVGALAALVAVIGAKLTLVGLPTPLIVVICLSVGVVASLLIGCIVVWARVAPFILTLGGLSVFLSLGLLLSQGTPIPVFENPFAVLGFGSWFGLPSSGVLFLSVFVLSLFFIRYSRLARNAFAVGANPVASFLSGVPVGKVTISLFSLSGLLVGVAGIVLLGRLGSGDANSGTGLELQAIAAVVLGGASLSGGRGSIWGAFLGVLFLGEISNVLRVLGTQVFYQQLIYGTVLIVAVVATALREDRRLPRVAALVSILRRDKPEEAEEVDKRPSR